MTKNPTWLLVVAAAFSDKRGCWLMHQRPEEKHHGGLWEFPGGKVEAGETPQEALIREVKEELAVEIREHVLEPLAFSQSEGEAGGPPIVILLYKITQWEGELRAMEGGSIDWFTPAQIASLARPPLDVDLCKKIF